MIYINYCRQEKKEIICPVQKIVIEWWPPYAERLSRRFAPRFETQVQRDMMFLPHPPLLGALPSMSGGQRRLIHLNLQRRLYW